jgi:hypothetical protein
LGSTLFLLKKPLKDLLHSCLLLKKPNKAV